MVSTILNHSMTNINIIDYATKLIVFFNAYLIFYTQITNISTNKSQKGYGQANTHGLSLFFLYFFFALLLAIEGPAIYICCG